MKSTKTLGFKFERTIPDGDRGSAGVPRAFVAHSRTGLLRGFSRADQPRGGRFPEGEQAPIRSPKTPKLANLLLLAVHERTFYLALQGRKTIDRPHHVALCTPYAATVSLRQSLVEANESPARVSRRHYPTYHFRMLGAACECQQRRAIGEECNGPPGVGETVPHMVPAVAR